MSFLRPLSRRGFLASQFIRITPRAFSAYPSTRAQNGYGDPKGSPVSENPQEQGKNPQVDKEHPGPPPPSAAGGKGGSSDSSSAAKSTESTREPKNGAKPTIHDQQQPDNSSEEVRKHNEELAQRKEKTHEKDDGEKVDPKFWKGHADDKAN